MHRRHFFFSFIYHKREFAKIILTCFTFIRNFTFRRSTVVGFSLACLRIRATIRSSARMSQQKRLIIVTRSSSNVFRPDRLSRCDPRLDRGRINSQAVRIRAHLRIVARVICRIVVSTQATQFY